MIQEAMKVMLDHGDCFVGINSLLNGLTPLLHCCSDSCWSAEALEWLIDRGAEPNLQGSSGKTALHSIFQCPSAGGSPYEHFEALVLLLERGADPRALDKDGKSVSYYAYHSRAWLGSMAGDLWDAALVNCGYDLGEFRRGYSRRPIHAWWYTRDVFQAIWARGEHLCPYYDEQDAFYFDEDTGGGHDEKSCVECQEVKVSNEEELERQKKLAVIRCLRKSYHDEIGSAEVQDVTQEDWERHHGAETRLVKGEVWVSVFCLDHEAGSGQNRDKESEGIGENKRIWYRPAQYVKF